MSADSSAAAMNDGNAAAASSRKRPRHFWEGPDPADDEEKQSSAHAAPVARLYRHALESVLGFLALADLSRALSVSRSWSACVRSMPSIGASVTRLSLLPVQVAASGLASHVGTLGAEQPKRKSFSCSDLFIVSKHLTPLTSLIGQVAMPQPTLLCFPPKLTALNIKLTGAAGSAEPINAAIIIISRLASLKDLTLGLPMFVPALTFVPLASASKLRDLTLEPVAPSQPSAEQMDQLRTLRSLSMMNVVGLSSNSLEHLLRTPHDLAWQRITDVSPLEAGAIAALASLPSLTYLVVRSCPTVHFLPSLKNLRMLNLLFAEPWPVAADAIVEAVSQCSLLSGFALAAPVTSMHMNDILSHLPFLGELVLSNCSTLESLAFLSEPKPIPCKLQRLTLRNCRNPALHSTELKRVSSVPSLTSLQIQQSFAEPLCAFGQCMLTPPTVVLPKLIKFIYTAP